MQPIDVNRSEESSYFICQSCSESIVATVKFQKMALESEKSIRTLLDQDLFDNTIKTEDAGEISQDALSLIDKIETTIDPSYSNVMITEDFETDSEISGSDAEARDEDVDKTGDSFSFHSRSKISHHVVNLKTSEDEDETAKIFNCELCPKKFKKPSLLSRHVKIHDKNDSMIHECQTCVKRFPSQVALLRHSIIHSELVERSKINRISQDFSCVVCGRTFKTPESLSSHLKSHRSKSTESKEIICKLCSEVFPKENIIRHSKDHIENATHQCCNKLFVIGDELIDHFLRHKKIKVCITRNCLRFELKFLNMKKHTIKLYIVRILLQVTAN